MKEVHGGTELGRLLCLTLVLVLDLVLVEGSMWLTKGEVWWADLGVGPW